MKRVAALVIAAVVACIVVLNPMRAQDKKGPITGTVIDMYCHATMDMGGKGHAKCAAECAKNGAPLGLKADGSGKVYILSGQKDMLYAASGLAKFLEQHVTVRGTVYEKDGIAMIVVDSATPAK